MIRNSLITTRTAGLIRNRSRTEENLQILTNYERARNMSNQAKLFGGVASAPKPGDFPVGSCESRAAARMRLQQLNANRSTFELIHSVPRPYCSATEPHATEWRELDDGRLMRVVYVPNEFNQKLSNFEGS